VERQSNKRVQLIHCSVAFNPGIVLLNPLTADKRSLSVVAAPVHRRQAALPASPPLRSGRFAMTPPFRRGFWRPCALLSAPALRAGRLSKAHDGQRPDPCAGVKAAPRARRARASGLGLDAEHGSGTGRAVWANWGFGILSP